MVATHYYMGVFFGVFFWSICLRIEDFLLDQCFFLDLGITVCRLLKFCYLFTFRISNSYFAYYIFLVKTKERERRPISQGLASRPRIIRERCAVVEMSVI